MSPRLQIRFELSEDTLQLYRPNGQRFLTPIEVEQQLQQERLRAEQVTTELEQERQRAEQEYQRAEQATTELEQERQRAQRLEMLLREAGIDPDQMS